MLGSIVTGRYEWDGERLHITNERMIGWFPTGEMLENAKD
jgi:hypothetical protein